MTRFFSRLAGWASARAGRFVPGAFARAKGCPLASVALAAGAALAWAGGAQAALTQWNNTRPAAAADYKTIVEAGSFAYTTDAKWQGGAAPISVSNKIVSVEERTSAATTTTIDGTVTVGELYSRSANVDVYVNKGAGGGKIVFDNGTNQANFYVHSAITRFTTLRCGFNVDLELKSDLNVYHGSARQNEAAVGILGGTISGPGKLTLNLANNDGTADRLFKFGASGANTYAGGTLVRHVGQTAYGNAHVVQLLVQMAVKSPGAFGTGNVTLDATGCTANSKGGAYTGRGMWIRFDAHNAFASATALNITTASRLAFDLNGYTQAVASVTVDGTPLASGAYTGGDQAWLFGAGSLIVGTPLAPAALTVTPASGAIGSGETVTVAAEAGKDDGKITAFSSASGPNGTWSVTGMAVNDLVPAGSNLVATATLSGLANLLNGAAVNGTLGITVDKKKVAGAAVNTLPAPQAFSYTLTGSVSGQTAPSDTAQTAAVPASGSFGGLSALDAAGAGTLAAFDTAVALLGGTNGAAVKTVAVTYVVTHAGAGDARSDVVSLAGIDGETFVLQMKYDASLFAGNEGDARLVWWQGGAWVNAVAGNHGANAPQFMGDAAWAGDAAVGHYGVDTANDVVWAVLNHTGDLAAGLAAAGPTAPVLSHTTLAAVGATNATLGATIDADGGSAVASYGTVWDFASPPVANPRTAGGVWAGPFTQDRTDLPSAAHLYACGWASNGVGVGYSTPVEFYTEPLAASNVTFSAVTGTAMTVSWANGNGAGRIVVMKQGAAATVAPADEQIYRADPVFGRGADLGNGNFVVYAGVGNTVNVTGLARTTPYAVAVFEYAGSGSLINYRQAAPATGSQSTSIQPTIFSYDGSTDGNADVAADWDDPLNYTADSGFPDGVGDQLLSTTAAASYYQMNGNRTLGKFRKTLTSFRNIGIAPGSVATSTLTWAMAPGSGDAEFYVRGGGGAPNGDLRCVTLVNMVLATNLVWDGATQRDFNRSTVRGTANGYISGDLSGPGRLIVKWNCAKTNLYNGRPMNLELWGGAGPNTHKGGTEFRKNNLGTRAGLRLNKEHATGDGDTLVGLDAEIYVAAVASSNGVINDATSIYLETDGTNHAKVELEAGVDEKVQGLYFYDPGTLAYVRQVRGTYGSTLSAAVHQDDTWFAGTGILTVGGGEPPVPPGTLIIFR